MKYREDDPYLGGTQALRFWLEAHMPELEEKVGALFPSDGCRLLLNRVTGLDIGGDEPIDWSCDRYLEALQRMKAEKDSA